ncbi:MAG: GNAT family N-acetyltransferase [Pseudomonadota bacterium]
MDRQPTLEGERLQLRPLCADDWEALFALASDPAVWEQHPIHDRWREDVFRGFFDDALAQGGALAVLHKASGELIGTSRFRGNEPDDPDGVGCVEIGWTFIAPRWWGRGINQEMKRLMLDHAFQYVERVEFRVGETNYRSRIALEKIGAERTSRSDLDRYQGKRVLDLIYEITADAFATGPLKA